MTFGPTVSNLHAGARVSVPDRIERALNKLKAEFGSDVYAPFGIRECSVPNGRVDAHAAPMGGRATECGCRQAEHGSKRLI